jgi:hypothetical protein
MLCIALAKLSVLFAQVPTDPRIALTETQEAPNVPTATGTTLQAMEDVLK